MVKLIIKLALAALLTNAIWRVGSAYVTFYRFKDAVTQTAQFGSERSIAEIQQRVMALASRHDIPLDEDEVSVRRDEGNHTYIDGSYTQPLDLLPGYRYPWQFALHVDVFTIGAPSAAPARSR
jgi:hypothetical protein